MVDTTLHLKIEGENSTDLIRYRDIMSDWPLKTVKFNGSTRQHGAPHRIQNKGHCGHLPVHEIGNCGCAPSPFTSTTTIFLLLLPS
jgi:hypothetical protein